MPLPVSNVTQLSVHNATNDRKTVDQKEPGLHPVEAVPCSSQVIIGMPIETAAYTYTRHGVLIPNDAEAAYGRAGQYYDEAGSPNYSYALRDAADLGHVEAAYRYAQRIRDSYYSGFPRHVNAALEFKEAEIYLRQAAAQGHVDASISYAELFLEPPAMLAAGGGTYIFNPISQRSAEQRLTNLQDAAQLVRPHAAAGNMRAQFTYATLTFEILRQASPSMQGAMQEPLPDMAEALGFLGRAAAQGLTQARYDYALRVQRAYEGTEPWPQNVDLPDFDVAENYLREVAQPEFNFVEQRAYARMWLRPSFFNGERVVNPLAGRDPQEQLVHRRQAIDFLYTQATRYRQPEAQYQYARIVLAPDYDPAINNAREGVIREGLSVRDEAVELLHQAALAGNRWARLDYAYELERQAIEAHDVDTRIRLNNEANYYIQLNNLL